MCACSRVRLRSKVVLEEELKRQTRVEDVLSDDDMLALDAGREIFFNLHDARALRAAPVGREGHVVHLERDLGCTSQVRHEDGSSAKHRNEHDWLACVGNRGILVSESAADFGDGTIHAFSRLNIKEKVYHERQKRKPQYGNGR